jgi:phospho-N-acetylmuramoyl-pentapeptide-transferase
MLYWIGIHLAKYWGPFRLLSSHLILVAIGTISAALTVWFLLPVLWKMLPGDRGKKIAADGGTQSLGKPTGAGLHISLIMLPIILLVVPPNPWFFVVLVTLYLAMWFGYLDDSSKIAWGEWKKGLLDLLVATITAASICHFAPVQVWLPFYKGIIVVGPWAYIPVATSLLWFTMNATNCSDGVDGLAGSLTLLSLFALGLFLYGVVGYLPIANYLLVPHNPEGAAWAILVATVAGALAGYLWHNAEPSRVLMGDAGSRLLGLLVGVAVLSAGNPFLIFVVAPMVLVNGGTGLIKLVLLRMLNRLGFDITPPGKNTNGKNSEPKLIIRALHKFTFPLHDHCRKKLKWSNAQVLLRFVLLQAFLIPLLFVILMKIR